MGLQRVGHNFATFTHFSVCTMGKLDWGLSKGCGVLPEHSCLVSFLLHLSTHSYSFTHLWIHSPLIYSQMGLLGLDSSIYP